MQDQSFQPAGSSSPDLPDYLRTPGNSGSSPTSGQSADPDAAVNLIRQKLAAIYAQEPNAQQEVDKIAATQEPVSKHQQYMQQLHASGKSWAEVQNEWHRYYAGLPDHEKHEVWQEFYAANRTRTPFQQRIYERDQAAAARSQPQADQAPVKPAVIPADFTPRAQPEATVQTKPQKSVKELKKQIRETVTAGGKLRKKDHLKSLVFGLSFGLFAVFISLFTFFNEMFITPFVQPSRVASETPVIVDPASTVVGDTPKIIIPKINVEIPTDYTQTSIDNAVIEKALDNGIVHYPTTVRPGQAGNAAFFGHSSNNIFNSGKYKFAFVLLHKMVTGDTFYITYEGKAYAYEVIEKRVIEPTEVGVLGPVPGQTATATLITCDPPGTSLKRLIVVGKQISPDPAGNPAPGTPEPVLATAEQGPNLPGNGPTLWSRMWSSIF